MHELTTIGTIQEPNFIFKAHDHSTWEIVYYISGTGIIKVGDEDVPFSPKTIVCLPPYIPHSEYSESGYRNIYFLVQTFDSSIKAIPRFVDNENSDFYNILLQLYKEFHLKQKNWRNITEGLLNVLHQYLIAWDSEVKKSPILEKFENLLLSNLSNRNFNIENALTNVGLSEDHFRVLFKKETGKTPLQYLTQKRIEYAKMLLKTRNLKLLKILEVARMSGFDDPYYFSRVFKNVTGRSPLDWINNQ